MPTAVFRDEVKRLVEEGAQLVEVLPRGEYEEAHLPGAISILLKELDWEATTRLRRDVPMIAYCHDHLWDMSPRAAWRLEGIGFSQVYDYAPGKADWSASGLPTEGTRAGAPTIGEAARREVPTCAPAEKVGAVRECLGGSGFDRCVVVSKGG